MMARTAETKIPLPHERANVQSRSDSWRVSLVKVPSGVAAGRTCRIQGNVHTESWALFTNRAQFDAFLTTDPLRHADPLRFSQLKWEFDHVFDRPDPTDLNL